MFWVVAGGCFLLWVGYGVFLSRTSAALRIRLKGMPRRRRLAAGIGLLLGSFAIVMVLMGSLLLGGAMASRDLAWWMWILIAAGGVGFVHAQVMGTAMLVTLAQESVTPSSPATSKEEPPDHHEIPESPRP